MPKPPRGWRPRHWASLKPFGIGEQRPNNYLELWRALRENRDQLRYAWRILNEGVCDGCALGTTGMQDWTLDGIHLCNIRLRLLRLNTMPALDPACLSNVAALRHETSAQLRERGRLPFPMLRRRGEAGFHRIGWNQALDLIADQIQRSAPERLGFYMTSRGIPNETYYVAQKVARALGTNSIDNAARLCHASSTIALRSSLGVGATTCSYSDWLATDLIVFIGSNVANNQPVATKYLYYAKKNDTKIAVINTYREPGMERYWVPSVPESSLFGTRLADQFFLIDIGGDLAFLNGALKHLLATNQLDHQFIAEHTTGFADLADAINQQSWEELERSSGASRAAMHQFGQMVADAKRAVFVWSMGVTQHERGEDAIRAIINLALTGGFVGREGCGVMPIRGHSGVQGGAEMGAYATAFPGGDPITVEGAKRLSQLWGFPVPAQPGMTTPEMLAAAQRGELDLLLAIGGNFREVLADPRSIDQTLQQIPLRVHIDIILSSQMLAEPGDMVLLLPTTTRYEIPGGVTETSTERRVIFSPEIPGPRILEARPEWQILLDLAQRVQPQLAGTLHFSDTAAIRAEIARVIPFYNGIQKLRKQGDQFQYGGLHLCANWQFPTADRKAHFAVVRPAPALDLPPGTLRLTTRRGKQFNTIVHEPMDALNGAERDAIMISQADAMQLQLHPGQPVRIHNQHGELFGRIMVVPVKPGNLEVHWPEGNTLLDPERRSPLSHIPDYNALVQIEAIHT